MGHTLALIPSSHLCCLSFRRGPDGNVVFCVEVECPFHLYPCLEADIKGEVYPALAYGSAYLYMQSGPEEQMRVVIFDVCTLAGSDIIGAEQHNSLIGALLRLAKLLNSHISASYS